MNQTTTSDLKSSAMVNTVMEDEIEIFSKNKPFGLKTPL